ncbi:MAG: NUDIX hydrolase [Pseudomonadota bacterium]
MQPRTHQSFIGAKLALFVGDKLLCLHRDDKPGLLWAGFWDLPGGGSEGSESPLENALRETWEEFTISVPPSQIRWGRAYTASNGVATWFFVGWMPPEIESAIQLGDEGQGWALMSVEDFMTYEKVVPQFKTRLADYFAGCSSEYFPERPPAN